MALAATDLSADHLVQGAVVQAAGQRVPASGLDQRPQQPRAVEAESRHARICLRGPDQLSAFGARLAREARAQRAHHSGGRPDRRADRSDDGSSVAGVADGVLLRGDQGTGAARPPSSNRPAVPSPRRTAVPCVSVRKPHEARTGARGSSGMHATRSAVWAATCSAKERVRTSRPPSKLRSSPGATSDVIARRRPTGESAVRPRAPVEGWCTVKSAPARRCATHLEKARAGGRRAPAGRVLPLRADPSHRLNGRCLGPPLAGM